MQSAFHVSMLSSDDASNLLGCKANTGDNLEKWDVRLTYIGNYLSMAGKNDPGLQRQENRAVCER